MKTADLYIRVSTDEQAEKGYSLRSQQEVLKKYCELNFIKVREIFIEDYSAKTFKRPTWQKYLVFVKRNKMKTNLLLFTKWDRFSRNTSDAYQMISKLQKQGIDPQAIEQPLDLSVPENKMMLAVYLTTPEIENDRRGLNTKAGIRQAKKEGRFTGLAPLGYINRTYEDGKKYITPKQPEADAIKWVFEQYLLKIFSGEHILKLLNAKGIKCSKNNFYSLLRNPTYMGKIKVPAYKDEDEKLVDGRHQPLITEKQFYQAQEILNMRTKERPRITICNPNDLPLRGMIKCPKCNRSLTGSASKGKTRYNLYYHCKSSCQVRRRADEVNGTFLDYLTMYIPRQPQDIIKELLDQYKNNSQVVQNERKALLSKIRECNQRVERARELMLDSDLEPAEYRKIKEESTAKINLLEKDLEPIESQTSTKKDIAPILINAIKNLCEIDKIYDQACLEGKKLLIITLFPQKLSYNFTTDRTQKSNSFAEFIYLKNSDLRAKKMGQKSSEKTLSHYGWLMGLEPTTLGTTNQYSNQLSYSHRFF